MIEDTMFVDYDDSLIGRIPVVDSYNFYGTEDAKLANEKKALQCFRYAIESVLEWTPEIAARKFDNYMIELMNLKRLVSYIDFPIEIIDDLCPKVILSKLYPDVVHVSTQSLIKNTFEAVLKRDDRHFPRDYFSGARGYKRFAFCLKYLIENYLPISTVEGLYDFFDSQDGKKFLYSYKLKVPAEQFSLSIPAVIHYITRYEPHSDLIYAYYVFDKNYRKIMRGGNGVGLDDDATEDPETEE
jgi:hypothetical protein